MLLSQRETVCDSTRAFAFLCDFASLREMLSVHGLVHAKAPSPQRTRKEGNYRLGILLLLFLVDLCHCQGRSRHFSQEYAQLGPPSFAVPGMSASSVEFESIKSEEMQLSGTFKRRLQHVFNCPA